MNERKRATRADWERVDSHEITPQEYEEIPELTQKDFARGKWHAGGTPVRPGRPPAQLRKQPISLRLDPDVLAYFRAGGRGWQGRINQALRKAAKLEDSRRAPRKRAR